MVAETRAARPLPRNPVMVLVLAWYVLLLAASAVLIMTMMPDRKHVVVTAEVIAIGVGNGDQIVAAWPDHNGEPWETVLTPRRPDEFPVGSTVTIRFDPEARESVYTIDDSFYEASGHTERVVFAAVAFVFAAPLLLAWTWRFVRWKLGARRPPQPASVDVVLATMPHQSHGRDREPAAMWLRLSFPDGAIRFQRVIWNRHVVAAELRDMENQPRVFGSGVLARTATARPCPGFRRMYIVDISDVGRLWPASGARRNHPQTYRFDPLDPRRFQGRFRGVAMPATLLAGGSLVAFVFWWLGAPIEVAATAPVLLVSAWLLLGAVPMRSGYA